MGGCFTEVSFHIEKRKCEGLSEGVREREGERERERERENSNSKTLILKDNSGWSIWTYPTASPCYITNTNKHDNTTNKYYKHD